MTWIIVAIAAVVLIVGIVLKVKQNSGDKK